MNIQYISNSEGNVIGVFIPINDWNKLRDTFEEKEVETTIEVPTAHIDIVQKRLKEYAKTGIAHDWDEAIKHIENDL
jgi:uncharacterized protein with von Willebrand factor type A (vWA) domain